MCNRNCCNIFWSVLLVLGLVATLGAPWYGMGIEYKVTVAGQEAKCAVGSLYGWNTEYCGATDSCNSAPFAGHVDTTGCNDNSNWRSRCSDTADLKCSREGYIMDVTLGLCVLALFCGLVTFIGFLTRCCTTGSQKSKLHMTFTFLGFLTLLVAMAYFAHQFPRAIRSDDENTAEHALVLRLNKAGCATEGHTPCNKLFGKQDLPTVGAMTAQEAWGGAGWIAAVLTVVLYLINLCLACTQSKPPPVDESAVYHSSQGMAYQQVGGGNHYQVSSAP